jgi:allophanate hydrolase
LSNQGTRIPLFVVGAHLSGMPLNYQLQNADAKFLAPAITASDYRLYVISKQVPPKPGLIRVRGSHGPGIAGEIWTLEAGPFGRFVADIPAPLGIGKVIMSNGEAVSGFLCEAYAIDDAQDITHFGGWRSYLAAIG